MQAVRVGKSCAARRRDAERLEKLRLDEHRLHHLRRITVEKNSITGGQERTQRRERALPFTNVGGGSRAERAARLRAVAEGAEDANELRRVGVRQRVEQDRFHDTEYSGVR